MDTMKKRPPQARQNRGSHRAALAVENLEDRRLMSTTSSRSVLLPLAVQDAPRRDLQSETLRSDMLAPARERIDDSTNNTLLRVDRPRTNHNTNSGGGVLNNIGNSSAVNSVKRDWNKLAQSSTVKTVDNKLRQFGDSLASSFKKLF
jgi:hypothetical protein